MGDDIDTCDLGVKKSARSDVVITTIFALGDLCWLSERDDCGFELEAEKIGSLLSRAYYCRHCYLVVMCLMKR